MKILIWDELSEICGFKNIWRFCENSRHVAVIQHNFRVCLAVVRVCACVVWVRVWVHYGELEGSVAPGTDTSSSDVIWYVVHKKNFFFKFLSWSISKNRIFWNRPVSVMGPCTTQKIISFSTGTLARDENFCVLGMRDKTLQNKNTWCLEASVCILWAYLFLSTSHIFFSHDL